MDRKIKIDYFYCISAKKPEFCLIEKAHSTAYTQYWSIRNGLMYENIGNGLIYNDF